MAPEYLTLSEAANYRTTPLEAEVIENLLEESPLLNGGVNSMGGASLAAIPFKLVPDRQLTINRESTYPTVAWYDPGEPVTGEIGTVAQTTFTIRGAKTRIVIPREVKQGLAALIDQSRVQLDMNLKAMTKEVIRAIYYGDNATNSKEPTGLAKLVSTATPDMHVAESSSDTAGALNLTNVDELISRGRGNPPFDLAVCSRQLYRRWIAVRRNTATGVAGNFSDQPLEELGRPVMHYAGIPILPDDNITDTETTSSDLFSSAVSGSGTSMYFIKFGPKAFSGISFSAIGPVLSYVKGPTQDYDGDILWVTWDIGVVMRSEYSVAVIGGIDPTAAIAA